LHQYCSEIFNLYNNDEIVKKKLEMKGIICRVMSELGLFEKRLGVVWRNNLWFVQLLEERFRVCL